MVKLTYSLKRKWKPIIIKQTGESCFHCKYEATELNPLEWGHLNGNENDNRPENFAFMCRPCNNRQKFNFDMIINANEQLRKNEKAGLVCERTNADSGTNKDLTSCSGINKTNKRIADQFLLEHTMNHEEIVLKDGVNAVVNICYENDGTGSQSAVYRYFEELSNPFNGKYTICGTPKGQNIIRRRTEN